MQKYMSIWMVVLLVVTQLWSNTESTKLSLTQIPANFVYDGCSRFPDGDYGECCLQHDQPYFFGGSWQERLAADNELFSCIKNQWKWYHQVLAPTMWVWVRIGGAPIWPTSYRWGFGRDMY